MGPELSLRLAAPLRSMPEARGAEDERQEAERVKRRGPRVCNERRGGG
jgi:hypothetical protein